MKDHENKPIKLDSLFKSCSRYTGMISRYAGMISPCFPFLSTASLRVVGQEGHRPLLHEKEWRKWCVSLLQWKGENVENP